MFGNSRYFNPCFLYVRPRCVYYYNIGLVLRTRSKKHPLKPFCRRDKYFAGTLIVCYYFSALRFLRSSEDARRRRLPVTCAKNGVGDFNSRVVVCPSGRRVTDSRLLNSNFILDARSKFHAYCVCVCVSVCPSTSGRCRIMQTTRRYDVEDTVALFFSF